MSWQQITFVVAADKVDALSNMLEGFLAQAITTENAGEDEFYEIAFPGTPDWQVVQVKALFNSEVDVTEIIDFVQKHFASEVPVQIEQLEDQNWQRIWLESFKPIKVGNNLWVCPSWCEPSDKQARNIILDPGLAFGTGTHPTTHMCLQWLADQKLNSRTVLDYGAGSGLLAIAALFSGASSAVAVDIDPLAVSACDENANRNGVSDSFHACLPSQLATPADNSGRYDLVIANILAEVIIELHDTLLLHLSDSGTLLLTGILDNQADRVISTFSADIEFEKQQQEQWCLLIGHRK